MDGYERLEQGIGKYARHTKADNRKVEDLFKKPV